MYTKKQIKKAFKKWETEFRLNPNDFYDQTETRSDFSVEESAKLSTKTLINYIKTK